MTMKIVVVWMIAKMSAHSQTSLTAYHDYDVLKQGFTVMDGYIAMLELIRESMEKKLTQ